MPEVFSATEIGLVGGLVVNVGASFTLVTVTFTALDEVNVRRLAVIVTV